MNKPTDAMQELIEAMQELDEDNVLSGVCQLLEHGVAHQDIMQILNQGMQNVGVLFEKGDYFLADLIVSGIIYRKALELLGPENSSAEAGTVGHAMIGVVKNDIHDIGKDIIVSALHAEGYRVTDIGADVVSEQFVEAALEKRPDLILLCGAMTFAVGEMRKTIKQLDEANVRSFAKIIVGGQGVSEQESRDMKADAYSQGPMELLEICRRLMNNG